MRLWLVEDRRADDAEGLEATLRDLADRSPGEFLLLGARPFWPDLPALLRAHTPDVLLIHEPAWPDGPATEEVFGLGPGVVVAARPERAGRFQALAEVHPLVFAPARPGPDCLQLALVTALAARQRQAHWKGQADRLQQRLADRIVIERAKGVLVQRLHLPEEEAYNRLRVQSRRQRRPIRDIAQSLLDTQCLLEPEVAEVNGNGHHRNGSVLNGAPALPPL